MSREVCFPKPIHTQHTPRLQEFCVSFHVIFHLKRTPGILSCTVLFFFPPTLPLSVILRDVIGWQRGLHIIGCCLLFVRILNNFLSVPKSDYCFICVRERSWGISFFWERLFNDDRNILYNRITLRKEKSQGSHSRPRSYSFSLISNMRNACGLCF